jgi:uncharacterized protein (TIGR00369 family)
MTPIKGLDPAQTTSGMSELMGREIVSMENGESEVHFTMSDNWMNMQGILHGGAFASMLDTACGVAARSVLDVEKYRGQVTLELKTSYLKAGYPGKYIAKGKVLRMGKRVCYADATLYDEAGDMVSRASATFSLLLKDA